MLKITKPFYAGAGVGILFGVLVSFSFRLSDNRTEPAPSVSGTGDRRQIPSSVRTGLQEGAISVRNYQALSSFLGDAVAEMLTAERVPEHVLDKFRERLENGQVTADDTLVFFTAFTRRWPQEALQYLKSIDQRVTGTLRLEGMVVRKIAQFHPELVTEILKSREGLKLTDQELYDAGVACFIGNAQAASLVSALPDEMKEKILSGEIEATLRRDGLAAMIARVESLPASAKNIYNERGELIRVSSGATSQAIRDMARLLPQTTGIPIDQFSRFLTQSAWWGQPMETQSALNELSRMDAPAAFALADTLKGDAHDAALRGAFLAAAEHHPEDALNYLSRITEPERQNSLLNILSQRTLDPEIRRECEAILSQRSVNK